MLSNSKWITSKQNMGDKAGSFYRNFVISKKLKNARAFVSSVGIYKLKINGKKIGNAVFAPGWTSYKNRILYQEYDVTSYLGKDNEIDIEVGQGWAVGYIGYKHTKHYFSNIVATIAKIIIEYADGEIKEIVTDESWLVRTTPVLSTDIYMGETVDMTAPIEDLGNAVVTTFNTKLEPQDGEYIIEQERLAPVSFIVTLKGERVIDFGQNMTGYVEIKIKAKRGARIVLHHAEVLDKDGNFYNENYRSAKNENVYVCSGGVDVFKPTFTFQGFRYIRLVEYPFEEVDLNNFRAVVVHSDIKRTGSFVCGNEKINQLYHNIIWGQKSNYLDVPTDCPQRDERLGWTGDANVFFRTAAINYDVKKFFIKWFNDIALEQGEDGAVMGVVPAPWINGYNTRKAAAWGDVATVVPWELYLAYGDKELLEKHFPVAVKWVEYMHGAGSEEFLWLEGHHYGDWLAMDGSPDEYVGQTPTDFVGSAWFAYSTSLVIKMGKILGKDVTYYEDLYRNVRSAFRKRYIKNGLPVLYKNGSDTELQIEETQTAYVLALYFDLCDESEKQANIDALVNLIRKKGNIMTTGFVGTPFILHALSDNGRIDVAYELLMQEKSPSWLYSVCHGATTMWEHWNSMKEDGSFWSTEMNSFNHYAYGAVYDWIFGVAMGIKLISSKPAYENITLEPHPNKCLGFAKATYDSKFGKILSHWYYKDDDIYYEFEIPNGVTAYLTLPNGYSETLVGGKYHFAHKEI